MQNHMPRQKKRLDIFAGIKPGVGDRGDLPTRPKSAALLTKPAPVRVETTKENMVSVSLTMPRALFERYNAGKSRGRFREDMVRQLWKKFE
jgi:hypothetical protein